MAETTILVLGEHGTQLSELADRIRSVGFRAIRAKTAQDAIDLAQERRYRYDAALIDAGLPSLDLAAALDELRARSDSPGMAVLATGTSPSSDERERLRAAGVRHALWQPVGDHALLFQLNRAVTVDSPFTLRRAQRVPTDWKALITAGGRPKPASVYSLSAGGAFLATGRPSMRGARMAIDLPLPGRRVSLLGRVVYTNVPGNLSRSHLPTGMGVCFLDTPEEDQRAIDEQVEEVAARYFV